MSTFTVSHCWACGKRFGAAHDGLCKRCRYRVVPIAAWKLIVGTVAVLGSLFGFAYWAINTVGQP